MAVFAALPLGCASQSLRDTSAQALVHPPRPEMRCSALDDGTTGNVMFAVATLPDSDDSTTNPNGDSTVQPQAEVLAPQAPLPQPFMGFEPDPNWRPDGYIIQPGDVLAIKFRVTSDLNEEVVVRPDGMISLHMIGDVMAAYMTPEDLTAILESAFKGILRDPQLAVIVRSFAGNQVYVGGEVQIPGSLALSGRLTTLQAIIQAGGFRDTADRHRVVIRRFGGGSEIVDLHGEIAGHAFNQDLRLQPYDVVYVPKSRIAKANLWVDQYINRVIPFQRSFGYFLSFSSFNAAAAATP
jgi:protein involved in polysaccharide export with SLBB domain